MISEPDSFSIGPSGRKFVKTIVVSSALICGMLAARVSAASLDWPELRGPSGDGHVPSPDGKLIGLPLHWSESENIKWKTEIPLLGWSSPVVMGGQVWLTTATEDGHDFYAVCVDAQSGQVRFNEKIFHCDDPESLGQAVGANTYATPSPVIEPGRVYVHFGTYGTACLDTATGKVIWQRNDLPCAHFRGPSSSPVIFENLLIVTLDGADLQYTVALDKSNGQTVWKTDRTSLWTDHAAPGQNIKEGDLHKGHSTPLIVTVGDRPEMLSADARADYGYDPRTGKEIWKIHNSDYSPAPIPLFDHGIAYFVSGQSKHELCAVKADGQGDVTESNVVWKINQRVGKFASPILVDGLLYSAAEESFVSCIEASSGNVVWSERIGGNFEASPVYADGHLYFFNKQGAAFILKPGRTCEVLATNKLADGFMASPAVTGKAFILRTKTHLYRVEDSDPGNR